MLYKDIVDQARIIPRCKCICRKQKDSGIWASKRVRSFIFCGFYDCTFIDTDTLSSSYRDCLYASNLYANTIKDIEIMILVMHIFLTILLLNSMVRLIKY